MPPTDEHLETSASGRVPFYRSHGGSYRRTGSTILQSDGRDSGELEGSTLGSDSRDGERRTPGQRRTQSSSGFLVDSYSLPRARSPGIISHRPGPSEPAPEKRSVPEGDIAVPKKRSRFPWNRHKNTTSESVSENPASSAIASQQQTPTPPPDAPQSRAPSGAGSGSHYTETPGLDRDSIQIVNLALNLNESRRRTASGFTLGPSERRPLSVSQPAAGPVDIHTASPGRGHTYQSHNYTQVQSDYASPQTQPSGQSPVVDLLPAAAVDANRAFNISESTIARAERARRHFDLFHEYLRLLHLLPPLRAPRAEDSSGNHPPSSATSSKTRVYNPLQMVRNRRIRHREQCPIDAAADGWNDVEKVHDWVNTVEVKYKHKTHGQVESISLPPFQQGRRRQSLGEAQDEDMDVASPPSSLRRASRSNSVKAKRPRLDWRFSPAELLADAAWVEDSANKAKIIDKHGNKLYPDPKELILTDADARNVAQRKQRWSAEMGNPAEDETPSRTSYASSRPPMTHDFKSVGRGRHRHRSHARSASTRSRSVSSSRKPSRWDRIIMRPRSVSSGSSAERRSVDQKRRTWGHSRKVSEKILPRDVRDLSESRTRRSLDKDFSEKTERSSPSTKANRTRRKASVSSAGSLDGGDDRRMSLEGMDSTAPSSPTHAGYFPSIAVNLSPPSTRSPSPAKKGFRHKIVSRHERSKSRHSEQELKDAEGVNMGTEDLPQQVSASQTDRGARGAKLEPSPLPDVVASSHADSPCLAEGYRVEGFRGRKGQHLPESKLRGIFKGPGRIAELVGNEVSKVGDKILKKDAPFHSRHSSSATDIVSEDSDFDEEERKTDRRSGPKRLLRHLPTMPTMTDDPRLTRRETDKGTPSRSFKPALPTFTSALRQDERTSSANAMEWSDPREGATASKRVDDREVPKRATLARSKTLNFHPTLPSGRGRVKPTIKDASVPFSMTRPPVTGLAQAQASTGPSTESRASLSGAHRSWSISDRSIQTITESGVPGKSEIERTRTLLLSSGIKAREITRRSYSVRDPPPPWLQSAMGTNTSVPHVPRINEYDVAAQSLLRRFENTQYSFQQSMHHFTTTTSSPLRSQIRELEALINHTLTPRVRATANEAEELCLQLNTTSTLAVKSLSDALDKGLRKRRRRLRWARRAGFVVLEWALVGMLWWVWLLVMAFKLFRGIFRGVFSGARWILWL